MLPPTLQAVQQAAAPLPLPLPLLLTTTTTLSQLMPLALALQLLAWVQQHGVLVRGRCPSPCPHPLRYNRQPTCVLPPQALALPY